MKGKMYRDQNGLLFILPAILIYTFVVGLPSLMTLIYSFTEWRIGTSPKFVGLENFKRMFSPEEWVVRQAIKNNIIWMFLMLLVNTTLAISVSGFLRNISGKAMQILRVVFYLPVILPRTVVCRIWMWLYNPFVGLQTIFEDVGISFIGLGNPDNIMFAIALVGVWCWWGFPLVIFLASLQQIDPIYYEAAKLEGAGKIMLFTHITIPMLRTTIIFIVVLTVITSFQIFDLVYIMTWGGPGRSSEVLATLIYKQGILQFQAGYSSALAVLQVLISSLGIAAYIYIQKKDLETI